MSNGNVDSAQSGGKKCVFNRRLLRLESDLCYRYCTLVSEKAMPSEVRVRARTRPTNGRKFILVANSKGGSGKSTLSINLAAAYARLGFETALVDCDPQQSSLSWLDVRPFEAPPINGINGSSKVGVAQLDWALRVPPNTSRIIVDSPGAMREQSLQTLLNKVDDIVVPILPSAIDMRATTEFLKEMFVAPGFRTSGKRLFVIGNRVEKRNKFFHQLNQFLKKMGEHELLILPDSYLFLRCADEGIGIADLSDSPRYKKVKDSMLQIVRSIEVKKATENHDG